MNENVPYVWRENYRNEAASPEKVLEIAHEQARTYLNSTVPTASRCEHALELLLTHRGNPAKEVDRILADDPQYIFAHCLRAALVVSADSLAARPSVAASISSIEAACSDLNSNAGRHAGAARAWLDGDESLASEYYGAIVIDWPHDILALFVSHALDFRLGRRRMMREMAVRYIAGIAACLFYPHKRTSRNAVGMSAKRQKQALVASFDYTIGFDFDKPGRVDETGNLNERAGGTNATKRFTVSASCIAPFRNISEHDASSNDVCCRSPCLLHSPVYNFEATDRLPIDISRSCGSTCRRNGCSARDGNELANPDGSTKAYFWLEI